MLLFAVGVQVTIGRLARPEIDTPTMMGMAISCAALFLVSILLHELGHALWARHERWKVEKITLYGFGGLAWLRPRGPYFSARAHFRIVAAGPLVTVVLVVLFAASERAGEALGWPRSVVDVAGLLTLGNLLVLFFNLIPAMPLDGGQMLMAFLVGRSGGSEATMHTLRRMGAISAYVALGGGAVLLATGRLAAGYLVAVAGFEILVITSIYYRAAASVRVSPRRGEVVGDLIRRLPTLPEGSAVNDLRKDGAIQLDPNTSLEQALEQLPDPTDQGVVVEDGRVTAIVSRPEIAEALLEAADARRASPGGRP